MRKRYVWASAAVSTLTLLSACGSSSKSSSSNTTTAPAGSVATTAGGSSATTSGGSSGQPIKIAFLSILSGPYSVPGGDDGFKLAVSQINASGGIMGRQIEYKEFNTDITPQGATTATALALQYHPDLVVGYGVSAGLAASASALNSAGVLVIDNTLDQITQPKQLGSDLYFRMSLTDPQFASGADNFLFQQENVKKMYVLHTSDAAPSDGASLIDSDAKTNNVSTQTASVSPTVTDLTAQVLAAKNFGAGAIWEWGYPTTDGLLIKQAAANGYTGDIMTFSAGSAAKAGLIPTSLLTNKVFSVSVSCAPEVLTTPAAMAYDQAFTAKYGTPPSTAVSNEDYDAVYLYKQAVTAAGSFDAKADAAALRSVDYQGVCGEEKADANQNMEHSLAVISFPGGKETLAKLVTNIQSSF